MLAGLQKIYSWLRENDINSNEIKVIILAKNLIIAKTIATDLRDEFNDMRLEDMKTKELAIQFDAFGIRVMIQVER